MIVFSLKVDWDKLGSSSQTATLSIYSDDTDEPVTNVSVTANPFNTSGISRSVISSDNPFEIYPNPVTNIINFKGIEGSTTIYVFDTNGKLLLQTVLNNDGFISVDGLPTGLYIIKLTSDDKIVVKKVYKE